MTCMTNKSTVTKIPGTSQPDSSTTTIAATSCNHAALEVSTNMTSRVHQVPKKEDLGMVSIPIPPGTSQPNCSSWFNRIFKGNRENEQFQSGLNATPTKSDNLDTGSNAKRQIVEEASVSVSTRRISHIKLVIGKLSKIWWIDEWSARIEEEG